MMLMLAIVDFGKPYENRISDSQQTAHTLRLILGDQLNSNHSWFQVVDDSVTYVMMEIRSETDYALHHIQK